VNERDQPGSTIIDNIVSALKGGRSIGYFQRDGKTVYSCATFVGYVGCLTGVRPGGWSVSVNERDQPGSTIIDNIVSALKGGRSIGYFLREALQTVESFDDALMVVSTAHLIAPVYITMAGVKAGEGAVVTRNRTVADDVWRLDPDNGRWFVLQTNDDHWRPPEDRRRDAGNKHMTTIGAKLIDNGGLFDVLSTPPVFASSARYTSQMVPAQGYEQTWIRWDDPPHDAVGTFPPRMLKRWASMP